MSLVTLLLVYIYCFDLYKTGETVQTSTRERYPYMPHAKDTHVPTGHANQHGDRVEEVWTLRYIA